MSDINNIKENFENINNNFENDSDLQKIREELIKCFKGYQNTMKYLMADAPISVLCLSSQLEKVLTDQGLLRVYDLFNLDLVKIKGIGVVRIKELTTRLDQFLSML